jgi:hypothetical protein
MSLLTVHSGSAVVVALLSVLAFTPRCSALTQEQSTGPRPEQVRDVGGQTGETNKRVTSALPDAPQTNTAQVPAPVHLDFRQRVHIYRRSMTNFETVLAPAFGAAVNQARDEPPEWGQGAAGYGTRFASGYGRTLISRTIRFGVAAVDHEDPRFHPSNETGFARRAAAATFHVFVAQTDDGSRIPAFSRFAGIYGSAFLSNTWYPASRANATHALLRGTTALSATVGWNVLREFWPDIKNSLHRRHETEP